MKVKQYEKLIDALQNLASVKPNKQFSSIEKLIPQRSPIFTHALSPHTNTSKPGESRRPIQITYTTSKDGSTGFRKVTKTLPDLPIFMNRKNPSIDQWLSKMQGKFQIN